MTDYHKSTGGPLTFFRTILGHLVNSRIDNERFWETSNPDYAKTIALMQELYQDLLKYKKTGSITCRHCNLVESSHRFGRAQRMGCPGWEPKGNK